MLNLFFYGTLKRGHVNHERFCPGYLRVEEATVRGRLYSLPFGFPALVVPEEDIYAIGTADLLSDAAEQQRLGEQVVSQPEGPRVLGELFVYDRFEKPLAELDLFEGFDPGGPSFYRRVLVPVKASSGVGYFAWAYAAEKPSGIHLPEGRWPA